MKTKIILLAVSLLIKMTVSSQSFLTNGQVYNFDIGDIIQGHHTSSAGHAYRTNTILSKLVSVNSITYTIQENIYSPATCQTCQPSSSTNTITQVITNLNSAVTHSNQTNCHTTKDTMYYNNCNRLTSEKYPDPSSSCILLAYVDHTTRYIEGVGGPFFSKFVSNATVQQEDYTLQYYSKQNGTCGTLITSINENNSPNLTIAIFPNPTQKNITIDSDETLSHFDVLDINGKVCMYGPLYGNKLNIEELKAGVYFLHVYTANNKIKSVKIIKE
ncbi:MAG: T9SS type A sorting domain-containing protein [Bacteroidetes bacterium]|nr:T9SS type A sorting domain-containing protein [Bacteroidota bacterium]